MIQDDNHNIEYPEPNNHHNHHYYIFVSSTFFKTWYVHNLRYNNAQKKTPPIAPYDGYSTYTSFSYSEARLVPLLAIPAEITHNVFAKSPLRAPFSVSSTTEHAPAQIGVLSIRIVPQAAFVETGHLSVVSLIRVKMKTLAPITRKWRTGRSVIEKRRNRRDVALSRWL
jgi:hypothetical protein